MADGLTLNVGAGGATLWTDDLGAAGHVQGVKILDATDNGTNRLVITAGGAAKVDGSAVNQPVVGPAASGASTSGNPVRVGANFNTTQPTVTNGQTVDLQSTNRGGLIIATGVDALNITNVSGTVSLPTGASTSAKQPALGTAGSASADVITVQGVASMTPVLVTATEAVLDAAIIAQEAATSGVKGITVFGAVTTSKPTYTTAKSDALSLDVNGLLRVSLADTPANGTALVVTANAGTNLNTSALALESGGNLATLAGIVTSSRAAVNPISGQAGVAGGVGATGATVQRVVVANDAGKTLVSTGGAASSSGNNTLVTAGTNKLKVYAFSLSTLSTTSVTCIFQSGAGGTELWRVVLQAPSGANTGANLVVQPPAWLFATAAATLLNLNLSAAQTVHWSVSYFDEA